MAIIPFHIVDAFAERPFTGNPAAVIPNAACLTEAEMLQITDELSMEAGFVLPPDDPGADVRLRFFTKRREALLSGHVVVAAFASMADRGFYRPTPEGMEIRLQTGAGILPVTLQVGPDGHTLVTLRLPAPRFGEPVEVGEVATALGLPEDVLRLGDHGPARVSTGFDQIVVPVNDRQAIRGVFREAEAIGNLTDRRGVGGVTLFCPETYGHDADFHCRFFHPRVGADEDVASGTALGAVAAYAASRGLVAAGARVRVLTEQGHALGRPNRAELTVHRSGDRVVAVDLAATGAVVMRGSFHFNRKSLAVGVRSRGGATVRGALTALLLGAAAGACRLDAPAPEAALRVQVRAAITAQPLAGIKVVVMDAGANTPVAGPQVTDAAGACTFDVPPRPGLDLLVFGGAAWAVLDQGDWWSRATAPDGATGPFHPAVVRPAPSWDVTMAPHPLGGSLPRFRGTVRDADTGAPLDQAFLSLSPFSGGYRGETGPSDDVTGPDGAFDLWDIPFAQTDAGSPLIQLVPVVVTRHGYRPALYRLDRRVFTPDIDARDLVIGLTPLRPDDTGVLRGRVLRNGAPAAGVPVALGTVGPLGDKSGAGLTGWATVSDAQGEWRFAGLPAGGYLPQPGYLRHDGSFLYRQEALRPYAVNPGAETVADDVLVAHEIEPREGAKAVYAAPAAAVRLGWSPVPGAARYIVSLDGLAYDAGPKNAWSVPDAAALAPGRHVWGVLAQNADGVDIGITTDFAWFLVTDE